MKRWRHFQKDVLQKYAQLQFLNSTVLFRILLGVCFWNVIREGSLKRGVQSLQRRGKGNFLSKHKVYVVLVDQIFEFLVSRQN